MEMFIDKNYIEFTISLFTRCNLRCHFCAQKHDKDLDKYETRSIPDKVLNTFIIERLERPNIAEVGVRFWGGELFSDDIPDSYFEEYVRLRNDITERFHNTCKDRPVKLKFLYTTNGVFTKTDRVLSFLNQGDSLAVSYDPTLRYPSQDMSKRVLDNIKLIHDSLNIPVTVGIVLTKPTLEMYLNNFDKLRELCEFPYIDSIVFNYYIPNTGWEDHMPSDKLLGEFLVKCLSHKFYKIDNIDILKKAYDNRTCISKECECKFLPNIFNGNVTKNCIKCFSNLPQEMFYGIYENQIQDISGSKSENISDLKALIGIEKRGCFSCQYADICPGLCWSSIIFQYYKIDECPLKVCFEYLRNN